MSEFSQAHSDQIDHTNFFLPSPRRCLLMRATANSTQGTTMTAAGAKRTRRKTTKPQPDELPAPPAALPPLDQGQEDQLRSGGLSASGDKSYGSETIADVELVRETLRAICRDGDAPAAARAQAARTLAEMSNALGRFAKPSETARKSISEMTREELEAELSGL